jgi:hypothetical protein
MPWIAARVAVLLVIATTATGSVNFDDEALRSASSAPTDATALRDWLVEQRLIRHGPALISLGVNSLVDLIDVEEQDLNEMEFSKLEQRRWQKGMKGLSNLRGHQPETYDVTSDLQDGREEAHTKPDEQNMLPPDATRDLSPTLDPTPSPLSIPRTLETESSTASRIKRPSLIVNTNAPSPYVPDGTGDEDTTGDEEDGEPCSGPCAGASGIKIPFGVTQQEFQPVEDKEDSVQAEEKDEVMLPPDLPPLIWRDFHFQGIVADMSSGRNTVEISENGALATFKGDNRALVTTGLPLPEGTHYWEVEIAQPPKGNFYVGVVNPTRSGEEHPSGWFVSTGGTDGSAVVRCIQRSCSYRSTLEPAWLYKQGDRVGVLLDSHGGSLRFFKNGIPQSTIFTDPSIRGAMVPAAQLFVPNQSVRLHGHPSDAWSAAEPVARSS